MANLSSVIASLVGMGWPRDYAEVNPPCWYVYAKDGLHDSLEDPDYAPTVIGLASTLVIAPPAAYFLFVDVAPTGELGTTQIEVYDSQGPMVDGEAGVIPVWLGLNEVLAEARLLYLQWEVQQLRESTLG